LNVEGLRRVERVVVRGLPSLHQQMNNGMKISAQAKTPRRAPTVSDMP
jgi:hypothetical protein